MGGLQDISVYSSNTSMRACNLLELNGGNVTTCICDEDRCNSPCTLCESCAEETTTTTTTTASPTDPTTTSTASGPTTTTSSGASQDHASFAVILLTFALILK